MSNRKVFSFTKGYFFSFEEEGNKIEAWFSALSGLEKIYLNRKLISSQRNLSTNSSHIFNINLNEYTINLKVDNIFKGPCICTLSKNGNEYKRQKLVFPEAKQKKFPFIVRFTFFIILGGLFGFSMAYWNLPEESIFVFATIIFLLVFFYHIITNKGTEPIIEDEEILQ